MTFFLASVLGVLVLLGSAGGAYYLGYQRGYADGEQDRS